MLTQATQKNDTSANKIGVITSFRSSEVGMDNSDRHPEAAGFPAEASVAAFGVLDMLDGANLVVERTGRVLWSGANARLLFDQATLITMTAAGKLEFLDPDTDHTFRRALSDMCGPSAETCRHLTIAPRSDDGSGRATVSLMSIARDGRVPVGGKCFLVSLRLLQARRPASCPQALQRLFDLTKSEAGVAASLAEGTGIKEVAHRRGRKLATIRNQQHSAYAKMGVTSQSELMACVNALAPRIAVS